MPAASKQGGSKETRNRIVVIGAGTNGLVAACLLAKAGHSVLVLERREQVGGGAITREIAKGFRVPALDHSAGPFSPELAAKLQLSKFGLEPLPSAVRLFAPAGSSANGKSVAIYQDPAQTARELAKVSAKDAAAYSEFHKSFERIGRVLRRVLSMTPPAVGHPTVPELQERGSRAAV